MSADLSDPGITTKYHEITNHGLVNWLMLSYGQSRDHLNLYASGSGGIEELQRELQGHEEDVFFAFLREDRSFILISFVPEDISGVRRARALVHSRAVGSFFKAAHATWTITKPEMLTLDSIREKLKLPADGTRSGPNSPALLSIPSANGQFQNDDQSSSPLTTSRISFPADSMGTARNKTGASSLPSPAPSRSGSPSVTSPTESYLNRSTSDVARFPGPGLPSSPRARLKSNVDSSSSFDGNRRIVSQPNRAPPVPPLSHLQQPHGSARSPISPSEPFLRVQSPEGEVSLPTPYSPPAIYRQKSTPQLRDKASSPRTAAQQAADEARARWAAEAAEQRKVLARQRSMMEMKREAEAAKQAQYDAERAVRLKAEREEAMQREIEEDDRRKFEEAENARRVAAERAAEDQRRRDDIAMRKAAEAQRKREEVALRLKREKEAELERERAKKEEKRLEEERISQKKLITKQFTSLRSSGAVMLTGNLTYQAPDSMFWRRRYFELSKSGLALYKSSDTLNNRLGMIPLTGNVQQIVEKHDELQSIPHSFGVEFRDSSLHLFYCDSEDDKELLTGALLFAIG